MSESLRQPDEEHSVNLNNFLREAANEQGIPISENGEDNRASLEDSQQVLTTEQIQNLLNFSSENPRTSLQDGQQALTSQLVQDPSNFSAGPANSSFPLHALSNGEVQDPTNSSLGQASSHDQHSSLPNAQQAAGMELNQNQLNRILGLAGSDPQHSSLPYGQQAANGSLQFPTNLSLEQANLVLRLLTGSNDRQAVPNEVVRHPPQNNVVQAGSHPQPSIPQNVQQSERNGPVQAVQNLDAGYTSVNHIQTLNLEHCNLSNGVAQPLDQEAIAIHNPGAYLNVSSNRRHPSSFCEALEQDRMRASIEVLQRHIQQTNVAFNDTAEGTRNTARNGTAGSHLGGPSNQQNPGNRNSAHGVLPSTSAMNNEIGASTQPDPLAHQGTLGDEAQLLNQINAPLLPQLPFGMNKQSSVPHQPSAPINLPIRRNEMFQQDEVNALLTPQVPNYSNNHTSVENTTYHNSVNQNTLNRIRVQQNLASAPLLNGSDAQDNNILSNESEQQVTGMLVHGQQYNEALEWISNLLSGLSQSTTTVNQLDNEDTESPAISDFQDHSQRISVHGISQGASSEQRAIGCEEAPVPRFRKLLGSSYHTTVGRELDPTTKFSAQLTRMRSENNSHEAISEAISVSELPTLDEEMVLNSKYTGFDSILWHAEEINSLTISEISKSIRPSARGTAVPVETLFNHLFRLSRHSFLQREEKVHLELTSLFLKKSRVEGDTSCEKDAKELIRWLERTFTGGHLAKLIQKLVFAIDETLPVKLLVDRAKSKYNPRDTEMTVLGAFYVIMNKQHDMLEMIQELAKRKQEIEGLIKEAKRNIRSRGLKAPKAMYEKKKTGISEAIVETDHTLIRSFDATKLVVVECTDSHYAYAQAVVEAGKALRIEAQGERDARLQVLYGQVSALDAEVTDVIPERILTAQVALNNEIEMKKGRSMNELETTVIECFLETILALGKLTVSALLQTVGGLPHRLALTLEEAGEELEKVRGIGSGEKPGVEDIVRVSQIVEEETEKHSKQKRILMKKLSYLRECQQVLNDGAIAGPAPV